MNQDSPYRRPTTDEELCAWILALAPKLDAKKKEDKKNDRNRTL